MCGGFWTGICAVAKTVFCFGGMVDGLFVDAGILLDCVYWQWYHGRLVLLLPMGVTFAGMILPLHQVRYSVVMGTSLAVVLTVRHSMGVYQINQISILRHRISSFSHPRVCLSSDDALYDTSLEKIIVSNAKEKQRWKTIFQSAQDGMLIVDADGKVIDVNPTLQGWLGPLSTRRYWWC